MVISCCGVNVLRTADFWSFEVSLHFLLFDAVNDQQLKVTLVKFIYFKTPKMLACMIFLNIFFTSAVLQVAQYLLDKSSALDEESMYKASLRIEPKVPN